MNRYFLFDQVDDYYTNLISRLDQTREIITMTFLAFDHGDWSDRISVLLRRKAAAGVKVRLMVDAFGEYADQPRHAIQNNMMLNGLRQAGVQVDQFQPCSSGLSVINRMHCKYVALDKDTVFVGGSNIGDYYTQWTDTNLCVCGELGNTFHELYNYLRGFSWGERHDQPRIDPARFRAGQDQILLTIPGRLQSIRKGLLDLILHARHAIFLRVWYFLPDPEIMNALCKQASRGVQVNVLLSDKTRVRPIDFANHQQAIQLTRADARVYRYTRRYLHSKVAWNDRGEILFGSANFDPHSLMNNFESCLYIHDLNLSCKLKKVFDSDLQYSILQTENFMSHRSLPKKMLTRVCQLASAWL